MWICQFRADLVHNFNVDTLLNKCSIETKRFARTRLIKVGKEIQ